MTLRPIIALAFARLRRRGPATAVSIGSIAAATTLVVVVFGIALIGADATLTRALAIDATDRPAVRISHFSISPRDLAATEASVTAALDQHGGDFLDPPVRGVLTQELRDLETPVVDLVIAVDDPAEWLTLTEGRAPAPMPGRDQLRGCPPRRGAGTGRLHRRPSGRGPRPDDRRAGAARTRPSRSASSTSAGPSATGGPAATTRPGVPARRSCS